MIKTMYSGSLVGVGCKLVQFVVYCVYLSIKVGDCDIQPLKHVRNLGTWFDNYMSTGA